jgi:DNA-binding winged helix-turn-helix (wHTH) protein
MADRGLEGRIRNVDVKLDRAISYARQSLGEIDDAIDALKVLVSRGYVKSAQVRRLERLAHDLHSVIEKLEEFFDEFMGF